MQNAADTARLGGLPEERFRPVPAPMGMPEQVLVREGSLRELVGSMVRPFLIRL